jgi:hypothetical protein
MNANGMIAMIDITWRTLDTMFCFISRQLHRLQTSMQRLELGFGHAVGLDLDTNTT